MTTPAPEHSPASGGDARLRGKRRTGRRLARPLFFATLAAVVYLTLVPNTGHARFRIVSLPLYRWIAAPEHDDFVNIVAFGFLAVAAFLVGRKADDRGSAGFGAMLASLFEGRIPRLAALLAFVCGLEFLQKWIPGRTSELQDVCSGCSGIFAAWLLCNVFERPNR